MQPLTRDDILGAFTALAAKLHARGIEVELAIMGGAAMVLQHHARDATQDVDVVILKPEAAAVRELAAQVAAEQGLRSDWLNDAAKGFLRGIALGAVTFSQPGLTARVIAPHQLLAMKLSAWRDDRDMEDAAILIRLMSDSRADAWRAIEDHIVPGSELKAGYAFDDIWSRRHEPC